MKQAMTKGIFTALFRNINLPFLASILLLGACSKDDNGGQPLPEGEYPMTFTAAGIALSVETKATTDNNWEGVQQVAIQVDGAVKSYDVEASGDYTTATLSSSDPFYWQSTDPIEVSAWWPYAETMPDVVVQANQSEVDNFHKSDYICALDQTVEFDGPHALQFSHRTAKVVVNPLVNGDGSHHRPHRRHYRQRGRRQHRHPLRQHHRPAARAADTGRQALHPSHPCQWRYLFLHPRQGRRAEGRLPIHLYHHRPQDPPRCGGSHHQRVGRWRQHGG